MKLNIVKNTAKWLLTCAIVLTPLASQAETFSGLTSLSADLSSDNLIQKDLSSINFRRETLEHQVVRAFEKWVIDFHDLALVSLYNPALPLPGNLLLNDTLHIGSLLSSTESANALLINDLLANYLTSANNYLTAVQGGDFCTFPNSANELISEWRNSGAVIANFIIAQGSYSEVRAQEIRDLFSAWTNFQVIFINNAAPQCALPGTPVNAVAADEAYLQVRALTYQVAIAVYRAFNN